MSPGMGPFECRRRFVFKSESPSGYAAVLPEPDSHIHVAIFYHGQ